MDFLPLKQAMVLTRSLHRLSELYRHRIESESLEKGKRVKELDKEVKSLWKKLEEECKLRRKVSREISQGA